MKKRGSILILVLFILIVTSLFSLLIFRYLKNIIIRSSIFYKFEKTYWLSFGGIQLEFVKIKYHGPGFEDTIDYGSNTNKKNRTCDNCYIKVKNTALNKIIGGNYYSLENKIETCDDLPENGRITLKKGEGILVPIFKDNSNSNAENKLSGNDLIPINSFSPVTLYRNMQGSHYILGITNGTNSEIYDGVTDTSKNKTFTFSLSPDTNTFLGLVQNTNTTTKYCIQFFEKIPTNRNYIISTAKYQDFSLTLKGVKYKSVPSFMIYSIIK